MRIERWDGRDEDIWREPKLRSKATKSEDWLSI